MKTITILIILAGFINLNSACKHVYNMPIKKVELIAVFKKVISKQDAEKLLKESGVTYREGMDSSKGKVYFYKTGVKYILVFTNQLKKEKFIKKYEKSEKIYELYTPDWEKQKD